MALRWATNYQYINLFDLRQTSFISLSDSHRSMLSQFVSHCSSKLCRIPKSRIIYDQRIHLSFLSLIQETHSYKHKIPYHYHNLLTWSRQKITMISQALSSEP